MTENADAHDEPQFENADINEIKDQEEQEQRERAQELSEGEQKLRSISRARDEKTVHVEIEGQDVPFTPMKGEQDEVLDASAKFAGKDEEELDEDELAEMQDLRDRVDELLGEKCEIEAADADWWASEFRMEERQQILGTLSSGGQEGHDAAQFRKK